MKNFVQLLSLFALVLTFSFSASAQMAHKDAMSAKGEDAMMAKKAAPTVIQLSQTEGVYETTQLNLAPGDYIFEVTNRDVAKDLGFYLQDKTDAQVANSGLEALVGKGETSRTGVVTLTEGSYQYSCPLNPTPHYAVNVGTPRVIHLEQTEGTYTTTGLALTPGFYVFEVENLGVEKDLGFYLQDAQGAQVASSGLKELVGNGETSRSGIVYLPAGDYQYSCPLNPTAHFELKVK
ncbi:hypothetical protein [Neolewinella agarilytica]|nr:hypothetical protein [Neolewinella agarilytica]